ncbi:M15 family metallopeptidase [Cellulosilyticum sp. I15G10I2]|uniref:M15 family metallopeptidase n=1 Tax=Cellulosilyticum sp. I15G10I2 TaxID=1892843 RepID=UPI00085C4C01|nr:M15 family metallopeptidase [Cellulosilyticum sp. I15G10I2]
MCLLKLVNKQNHLSDTYVPTQLVQEPHSKIWLCECTLTAFSSLNTQLVKDGLASLILVSGYRAYDYQKKLYDRKTNWFIARGFSEADARIKASEIVTLPGCSEHQLGLAIDVTSCDMKDLEDPLTEDFQYKPEGHWLNQNAHKYGFILRYPQDKTALTQISYEPWHYRYIGIKHAIALKTLAMCLEEYIDYIAL